MTAKFIFWDVQHGHSTYIQTPNGRHIVIDLGIGSYGSKNEAFSPLSHLKKNWNIQQIDYAVITHPHLDHIDDILNFDELSPRVLHRPNHITNEEIMQNVREQDKIKFKKYCEINDRYNGVVEDTSPHHPKNPKNWGGLSIQTFHPCLCDKANFNNHSIVVVMEYLNTKVVIPGDNEDCSISALMADESFTKAVANSEILLAPHHGRESGHHSDFLNLVNPLVTIVSDGKYCDTSANKRYSAKSRGWDVNRKGYSQKEFRRCLTTNSDGVIRVEIDKSQDSKYKSAMGIYI